MGKRKMVVAKNLQQELARKLQSSLSDWEIIIGKDKDIWQDHVQQAEVIAGWNNEVERLCLEHDSKLRWVQSWSAGVDSYPLDKLAKKNIHLTSANGVHGYPISETIFALMLSLTRNIHSYVRNQVEKKWHHANLRLEVHKKTIGIIGIGAIGKETAKIAKAFDMDVIGVRNTQKDEAYVDKMVTTDRLDEILPSCDYVVLTVPLTKNTYHLFGEKQFNLMKSSSFFINIGRGEVVDEAAMIQALQEEKIAGAGLDVFETEPLEKESPLWDMENVIITPHTAGATEEYDQRVVEDILIPNLRNYINEQIPSINLVDYTKGY
ncbi:D-2-hydroxyacid dehydrogenase [Aquibacillus albus]|uniref:Phosphoglycerate dehydrogenase-like enzyme n=1 Tax=Aquibacillus albus TaxID=1168171 RepID=A0ABS2MYU5_9BACI|nr:D-2-hydroxyacid dehydrogenase [Aquibacillus albus]MBM7570840.1 phosphoglycerate dehydrogenase-like enzyme [Aquibacillus albus]